MRQPALQQSVLSRWIIGMASMLIALTGCAKQGSLVSQQKPQSSSIRFVANQNSDDSAYSGPLERTLRGSRWEKQKADAVTSGESFAIDGLHDYQAAESLYLDGRYAEAEKAFKRLAKQRRSSQESFTMRMERFWGVRSKSSLDTYTNFGDPIEEDALFMKAECQFEQKKYATAQDSYDALLTQYPSTRHLDAVSRRYFRIARYWLGFPEDVNESGDVKQVSNSEEDDFANSEPFHFPLVPNLTDKTRPMFDTRGRALAALRSIWLHDATGPLADDALMVSASFLLRAKDFEESARHYKMLREQYPESPHFRDAFLLGSHVTLASYQGSNYDGQSLDEAIELKEAALRIFPDLTEEERNRLGGELQKMYDAEVARIWDRVEYFQAKQAPESVAVYCKILINRFPDTVYAERARQILEYQARTRSWAFVPQSNSAESTDDTSESSKSPGMFPGLNKLFRKVPEETPAEQSPAEEAPPQETTPPSTEEPPPETAPEDSTSRPRVEAASAGRASFD